PAHTLERQDVEEFKDEPFKKKIQTKPVTAFVPRPAAAPIRPTAQSPNLSSDKTPWEGVEWPKEWQKKDD
ncbi:MAG: hypothetical protein L3J67_13185, partial [Hyphomicrobiaceae bacterium]|nr:hypothetical protein [Hyphomicrobiaceae bacterium]